MDELNTDHIDEPAVALDEAPALIIEPEAIVEPTPEPTPEPVAVPEPTPEPVVVEEPVAHKPKATQAVSGNDVDEVLLANCIYKNVFARKSLSVHHLQRRLVELGFKDADADKDGWLGDETVSAIKNFQASKGLDVTGSVDATTLTKIFEGDHNVVVIL
jgi:peptidoglycan hydrolase-like protein with peptidoglycan-binding domain